MKTTLSILAICVFALSAFGQSRKPGKPAPRKLTRPVARNTATRKIYVQKNDGSSLTGLFVGGDSGSITVRVSNQNQVIKLDEIRSVIFTEGIATRIGTDSQIQTENSMEYKGSGDTTMGSSLPRKISGGVLNGKAVLLVKPEYPAAARAVRASGAVNVQVTIEEDGSIKNASAVSGHPLLRQAAENAARASKFAPVTLNGQPVSVTGIIVYNFTP